MSDFAKEEHEANMLERKMRANLTPCYKCGGTDVRVESKIGQYIVLIQNSFLAWQRIFSRFHLLIKNGMRLQTQTVTGKMIDIFYFFQIVNPLIFSQ